MKNMVVVADIDQIQSLIRTTVTEAVASIEIERELPQWINLELACRIKGCAYNTVKSNRRLQPNNGVEDAKLGGRRVWSRETILSNWIMKTDRELEADAKGGRSGDTNI